MVDDYFEGQKDAFTKSLKEAIEMFSLCGRSQGYLRTVWATWIFSGLCATCHSISRLSIPIVSDYGLTTIEQGFLCAT